jgi:hypothetical protein
MADHSRHLRATLAAIAVCLVLPTNVYALSDIKPDETAPPTVSEPTPLPDLTPGRSDGVPMPDPVRPPQGLPAAPQDEPAVAPDGGEDGDTADPARPNSDPDAPVPEILYDLTKLPEPVQRMHRLILEATKSGEIDRLKPLLGMGDDATMLSLGGIDGDPIEFLKQQSGDGEGHEILAILEEVLEAGFVHIDIGKPEELYVWPYFFAVPLEKLTSPQFVELFRIVTAGDYEEMKNYGAYVFYRVGITPDGRWTFFVAGD